MSLNFLLSYGNLFATDVKIKTEGICEKLMNSSRESYTLFFSSLSKA